MLRINATCSYITSQLYGDTGRRTNSSTGIWIAAKMVKNRAHMGYQMTDRISTIMGTFALQDLWFPLQLKAGLRNILILFQISF